MIEADPGGVEKGEQLSRQLSAGQLTMIAIGGAIGTGLFLGSSLAVRIAGPGVILSYLIGAAIALLLMSALSEMAVAHPTAGSFGVYAELYVNAWAGFTIRYTYWAAQMRIAVGGEATAIAIYCQWWFPHTPKWIWILGFSVALLWVNARSVASFGSFEYWFAAIKVVAIVLFIGFGLALLAGFTPTPAIGFSNFTTHGGFLATGWRGVWMAMAFVIFSYIGTEVISSHGRREAEGSRNRRPARFAIHGRAPDSVLFGSDCGADRNRSLEPGSNRHRRHGEPLC